MPPEPSPWDRKDLFREKKHERSDSVGSVGRWRDSHHGSREFVRWGSEDFRRPSGHGKQGGYQLSPCRGGERSAEEEIGFRPSALRGGDGKYYARGGRETKGSFSQRDWRGHGSESGGTASFNSTSGRQNDVNVQRSVSDMLTYSSHAHSVNDNSSWDQLHFKDQHDKMGGVNGLATGHRYDKDQALGSMAWKPMKWNRSTSLSSRASGFSHSSSSKSLRADSDDSKPDLQSGRVTPVQSPSGDGVGGTTSSAPSEDACPRKKQRLGWGQGLAKYEKEKVEGSDETLNKNGLVPCAAKASPTPSTTCILDRSPRVTVLSDCASPATTSSVACSSSPGMEDKGYSKDGNNAVDTCNSSGSPGHGISQSLEELAANPEQLELNSMANLASLLNNLPQHDDASTGDSNFVKSTALNKILLLKGELLKSLEKTEHEIDLLENELKQLNSKPETNQSCPITSNSLQVKSETKPKEVDVGASKLFQKPATLQVVSSGDTASEKPLSCDVAMEGVHNVAKDDDIDSPGTATSKLVQPLTMEKAILVPCQVKERDTCLEDAKVAGSTSLEQQCESATVCEKKLRCEEANYENGIGGHDFVSEYLSHSREAESKLSAPIFACNRDSANKAVEVFSKLLPANRPSVDVWASRSLSGMENYSLVKEKLVSSKCFLRFKEQVLYLKFRAFQHLWKEDMRLLSIRKHKAKSQKKFDLSSRTSQGSHQKHRSSIRSRFALPAGNVTLVPTTEILNFAEKLLSDSRLKVCRNSLKMPAQILDDREKRSSKFSSSNGLVEDPCAVEKERSMTNPWTADERQSFLELFNSFGKDFKKISLYIPRKTTADCVEFYYKNHKSDGFGKIKKSDVGKQGRSVTNNTYLVTSSKKWNHEVHASSLELLGAASVIASRADEDMKTQQSCKGRSFSGGQCDYKRSWDESQYEKSGSVDILGNEKDAMAADTLAGFCGALSSEAVSSCVTSSIDPADGGQEWKLQKRSSSMDGPLTPEVLQNIDDDEETCSDESCGELDSVDWTDEEKSSFIGAFRAYGKDFAKISRCVGTRSKDQCKIFFSKGRKCLGLDVICPQSIIGGTPTSDAIEGRSDTEDAGVPEMESAICSTQSCSKGDIDMPLSVGNVACGKLEQAGTSDLLKEPGLLEKKSDMEQLDYDDAENGIVNSVPNDCQAGMKPNLPDDGECKKLEASAEPLPCNGSQVIDAGCNDGIAESAHQEAELATGAQVSVEERTSACAAATKIDDSVCAGEVDISTPKAGTEAEPKATSSSSATVLMSESEKLHCLATETVADVKQVKKTGMHKRSRSTSSSCLPDLNSSKNVPFLAVDTLAYTGFSLTPGHQHQNSVDMPLSSRKGYAISRQQKENFPEESTKSAIQDSSGIYLEERVGRPISSTTTQSFDDSWTKKPSTTELYQQYLLGHNGFGRVETSQILRGYPLQALNKKEMNGCTESKGSEKQLVALNISKVNGNFQAERSFLRSELPVNFAELTRLSKSQEPASGGHSRSHSHGRAGSEEQGKRNGDVKLFGQILSHPTNSQKPSPNTQDSDDRGPSAAQLCSKSFSLRFGTDLASQRSLEATKLDTTNHSSLLEDFPRQSYGFWDGSRIQTRLSALPESARILAKYPAAFDNYTDQHSVVVEMNQNPDFNVRRNYSGATLQPLTVNPQDAFSELQKRNGYEAASYQNQTKSVVGMNVMGGGIVVGASCGVSDPVAAIKKHYAAAAESFSGQGGNIREGDAWRGPDVGR
ncbi:hypothetical protein Sjap_001584 [Stephania japonica]|uniref:SANT domain-containing protein n=1 Tax=Stephania japonica TaxID=461633 RepID=A0AAP0PTN1_9MAGN